MDASTDALALSNRTLSADILRLVGNAAQAARIDINEEALVYGGSYGKIAAVAPVRGLEELTAEDFATGVQVGIVLLSGAEFSTTTETERSVPPGAYVMTAAVASGAQIGKSQLLDNSGAVVASAPLHVVEKNIAPILDSESFTVGGVTVEVGWFYVCFDWNDPPGTPGGVCHHVCYGWH